MTTFFVSRHPGAIEWAREEGIAVDQQVEHLDPDALAAGDRVLGTLPVHLAAKVCELGACYFHLSLEVPRAWRGEQLTAAQMRECKARLERYDIRRLTRKN